MSDTQSFEDILSRPSAEVERPKPLPAGTYVCVVKGLPKMDKSSKKQTMYAEFQLQPIQVTNDEMVEGVEEVGGLEDKQIRATFYLTDQALYRLKDFLVDDLGIEEGDKSIGQMLNEAPGKQCLATLKHRTSEDGKATWAELASTAPVE